MNPEARPASRKHVPSFISFWGRYGASSTPRISAKGAAITAQGASGQAAPKFIMRLLRTKGLWLCKSGKHTCKVLTRIIANSQKARALCQPVLKRRASTLDNPELFHVWEMKTS